MSSGFVPALRNGWRISWLVLHGVWRGGCVAALVLLLGLRALRYAPVAWGPAADVWLGEAMVEVGHAFVWPWAITALNHKILIVALPLGALLFRKRLVRHLDERWRFTPFSISFLCGAALWVHYLFDMSAGIGFMCALSLLLALGGLREGERAGGWLEGNERKAAWAGWGIFFVVWLVLCGDFADRLTVVGWGLALGGAYRYGTRWLGTLEIRLTMVMLIIVANFAPAIVPLFIPLHGGTRVGDGLAYDFCEVPDRNLLVATIPACSSLPSIHGGGFTGCVDGRVELYDAESLAVVDSYRFFSDAYYGRLEQLVCIGDEIHVSVQGTNHGDKVRQHQTAMSFNIGAPQDYRAVVAGIGFGSSIGYDSVNDAVYYSGEYTGKLVRIDRATNTQTNLTNAMVRPWIHPLTGYSHSGSLGTGVRALDVERKRLYFGEWLRGRYVYGLDLSTLQVVERFGAFSGSVLGATVDAERDRLLVASMWGLEVFDLNTGSVITRKRLGFTNRPAVVDPWRNRVYISSAVDGKIRVLDRDSYELVDQIAIGMGPRYLHLSSDGRRLFGSSTRAHYVWELEPLE